MLSLDDLYTQPRVVLDGGREHVRLLGEGWKSDTSQAGVSEGFLRLLSPSEREQNRQQAKKGALRCFFRAWACYLADDKSGTERWLRHVSELAEIVRDG